MALFMSSFVKELVVLYYRSLSMTSSDSPRDLLTAPLRKYVAELTGNIVQVLIVTHLLRRLLLSTHGPTFQQLQPSNFSSYGFSCA